MSGGSAVATGVIGLVLCAGSVVAGFLNKATHHPKRFIFFLVLAAIFLIASVFVLLRGRASGAGASPASK
ncbi:MAG TPA: hypothetical protein VMM82_06140 [Spirochaetia bacterium]|nr:hypothetical protein [Spirochaetia bacterium]